MPVPLADVAYIRVLVDLLDFQAGQRYPASEHNRGHLLSTLQFPTKGLGGLTAFTILPEQV